MRRELVASNTQPGRTFRVHLRTTVLQRFNEPASSSVCRILFRRWVRPREAWQQMCFPTPRSRECGPTSVNKSAHQHRAYQVRAHRKHGRYMPQAAQIHSSESEPLTVAGPCCLRFRWYINRSPGVPHPEAKCLQSTQLTFPMRAWTMRHFGTAASRSNNDLALSRRGT